MPRKAKSPARAEATGDWDHREAAPASQLDAFGFRKKSAYTPDDAHKVDAQMAKWVAEGKYSDTQGATGSFNDFYVKQLHKIPRPKKTINQEAWAFVLFLSTNLTALLTYAGFFPKLVAVGALAGLEDQPRQRPGHADAVRQEGVRREDGLRV